MNNKTIDTGELPLEEFGAFVPLLLDEDIINIRYNGQKVMVQHQKKSSYIVDLTFDHEWIDKLAKRISDKANVNFNTTYPSISVDLGDLRITILDKSICNNGTTINFRKTGSVLRMNDAEKIIEEKYCDRCTYEFLSIAIKIGLDGVWIGPPGCGKTEAIKFFAGETLDNAIIFTLEDTSELHLEDIYPNKFIIPVKTNKNYDYVKGIMDAKRTDTTHFFMAECREKAAKYALSIAQTATCIWTSFHSETVQEAPDNFNSMLSSEGETVDRENEFYSAFDFGVRVRSEETPEGIKRNVEELCIYERTNKKNIITMLIEGGKSTGDHLPLSLQKKLKREGYDDPFIIKEGKDHE